MVVVPVAVAPDGRWPSACWITEFGTADQLAVNCSGGCERTVPLMSTSIFGIV